MRTQRTSGTAFRLRISVALALAVHAGRAIHHLRPCGTARFPASLVTELRPLPAADPRSPPLPPVGSTPLPPRSQDVARISGSRNRILQGNDRKAACRGALVSQCCCGARSAFDTEPCSTFGLPASSAAASVSALGSSEPAMASSARPVQRTDALHAMEAHSDSPWLSAFSSFASSGLLKSYQGLRGLWT